MPEADFIALLRKHAAIRASGTSTTKDKLAG
jgi:hypothetical protein